MFTERYQRKQAGLTLIEIIVFILVVSVALIGILSIMRLTTIASTDPMRDKQALAIAESLIEEIQLQAFTYCDPDDANASTATSAAACASTPQGLGPTAGETRYAEPRFDNVGDYHGFTMAGIRDIQNNAIVGLEQYTASVTETLTGDQIQIDVLVTSGNTSVLLTGYRYRFAPRALP